MWLTALREDVAYNDPQMKQLLLLAMNGEDMQFGVRLAQAIRRQVIHNATEENLIYPALAVVGRKKAQSLSLYHETAEADTVVFELNMLLEEADDKTFTRRAKKLQAAVLEHIEKEETSAFPQLQEKANSAQSRQLAHDVREFRNTIHMKPD